MALSAGYLLASQAERLYMTQTGMVGSIGIVMAHHDISKAEEKAGVRVTLLHRGARKVDFNSSAPLTTEARAWAEGLLDERYEQFVSAVVRGRGVDAEAVRDTEAGILHGAAAVSSGLADGIASYRDVITEFSSFLSTSKGRTKFAAAASASAIPQKEGTRVSDLNQQADAAAAPDLTELRKQMRAEVQAEFAEISAICEVAGRPQLAAKFITEGKSKAEVLDALRTMRASADNNDVEIESAILPDAGASVPAAERYGRTAMQAKPEKSCAQMMRESLGLKGAA
jgi:capsid assembly protease